MRLDTVQDILQRMPELGKREALRDRVGYRSRVFSYSGLYDMIVEYSRFLGEKGIHRGDRLLIWAENSAEWAAAFWAAVSLGVVVVPLEARFSSGFVDKVARETGAALLLTDREEGLQEISIQVELLYEPTRTDGDADLPGTKVQPQDMLEIIYTSGTTGEPKGVVHRHKHICSDLTPIAREIGKYRPLLRPLQPLRTLNLLPLSHMFGQALGLFIPVLLGGSVIFSRELSPGPVLDTIRRERASTLVAVPRIMRQLKEHIQSHYEEGESLEQWSKRSGFWGRTVRIWRHRRIHSLLGWKFWILVVGGAELGREVEAWWRSRGFLTVQGYGLTEASPIVALNHPLRTREGSLGKLLEGQEARIAHDGELLLKGENISLEYFGSKAASDRIDENGWLHTGDIVEQDEEGRLYYKGRKKDVIVTADGMNVHPEDVEEVLLRMPGVRNAAVVDKPGPEGESRVHAVLITPGPEADAEEAIRRANQELEPHQRILGWSVWPEPDFPRTPSTQKVLRREVSRWVREGDYRENRISAAGQAFPVRRALSELTGVPAERIGPDTDPARELGLSSLDMVELSALLESSYGVDLDEALLPENPTVGQLEASLVQGAIADSSSPTAEQEPSPAPSLSAAERGGSSGAAPYHPPRWNRSRPVRWGRTVFQELLWLPGFRIYMRLERQGWEHLRELSPPVLFAANHSSHLDTTALLASLPLGWRRSLAVSMQLDFFRPYFFPAGYSLLQRTWSGFQYVVACGLMNSFPLPQRAGGLKSALRYAGELADHGYCPLVFPEGIMTQDGNLMPFRPGISMLAENLRVPVVPVGINGLFDLFPHDARWPRPGRIRVSIGPALYYQGEDYSEFANKLHERVAYLMQELTN